MSSALNTIGLAGGPLFDVPRRMKSSSDVSTAIAVITNPNSGKNRRLPQRLEQLDGVLGGHGLLRRTRDTAELHDVVHELFDRGCRYWVCDGGDGSLNWLLSVIDEVAAERGVAWPIVIPANGGTIDFVARKAGVRGQAVTVVRKLVRCIERGQTPRLVGLDTLRLEGTRSVPELADAAGPSVEGAGFRRIGFATAIAGVAQRFFDKLYQTDRISGWAILGVGARATVGGLASATASSRLVPELQRYAQDVLQSQHLQVEIDGRPLPYAAYSSLQVGSIDINLGGVVRTFRFAQREGVLHAQALGIPPVGLIANLPNMVLGTRPWGREIFDGPAERMVVTARDGEVIDPVIDGELFFGLQRLEITRGPKLLVPVLD